MVKNLNPNLITTKKLYDRLAHEPRFLECEINSSSAPVLSFNEWLGLYTEVYEMQLDGYNTMMHPDSVEQEILGDSTDVRSRILILDFEYEILDENATANGWLSVSNNQLFHVPGQPSPFIKQRIFAIGVSKPYLNGNELIVYDPKYVFSDIPNSGYNGTYSVQFPGMSTPLPLFGPISQSASLLAVGITHLGVTHIQGGPYRKVEFFKNLTSLPNPHRFGLETIKAKKQIINTPNDEYEAAVSYLMGKENGKTRTCLKKPIIFVEGIDFGYASKRNKWENHKWGNLGFADLFYSTNYYFGLDYSPFDPDKRHEPFSKTPNHPFQLARGLFDFLNNDGYDVIYVDFRQGTGFIENNAMVLVEVIKSVQQKLNACYSCEEISVLGASMGGLVSRYALLYMEQNNIPHKVRLFISADSPQEGANLSIGVQYLIDNLVKEKSLPKNKHNELKELFEKVIQSPAVKQLILSHIAGYTKETDFRHNLKRQLMEMGGYPKQARLISLSNGSFNGSKLNFSEGDVIGEVNLSMLDNFITSKIRLIKILQNPKVLIPFNIHKAMADGYANNTWDNLPMRVVAQIDKGAKGMYRFLSYRDLNMDNAPGGYSTHNKAIESGNPQISKCLIPESCLIPIKSAFGMADFYGDLAQDISTQINRTDCDPRVTPFHSVYAPNVNEHHMAITMDNINWLLSQLDANEYDLGPNIPEVRGASYNFGNRSKSVLRGITINPLGKITVGNSGLVGWGNTNTFASHFPVHVNVWKSCNSNVIVERNGTLEIGDPFNPYHIGSLTFNEGTNLILKSGSTLRISDKSKLKIGIGANIIIEDGVKIIFNGNESEIEIHGKVYTSDNAFVEFTSENNRPKGKLSFKNFDPTLPNVMLGINSTFKITGDGVQDLTLNIESLNGLFFQNNQGKFDLRNARVELAPLACIETSSIGVDINNIFMDVKPSNVVVQKHGGIIFNGQNDRISIHGITIKNATIAFNDRTLLRSSLPLKIKSFLLENCDIGVYSMQSSLTLENGTIKNSLHYGVYINNGTNLTQINSCKFLGNASSVTGVRFNGIPGLGEIIIKQSLIRDFKYGFHNDNGNAKIPCTEITNCWYEGVGLFAGDLTLNYVDGGAFSQVHNNKRGFYVEPSATFDFNNGYARLDNQQIIKGNLNPFLPYVPARTIVGGITLYGWGIECNYNYWGGNPVYLRNYSMNTAIYPNMWQYGGDKFIDPAYYFTTLNQLQSSSLLMKEQQCPSLNNPTSPDPVSPGPGEIQFKSESEYMITFMENKFANNALFHNLKDRVDLEKFVIENIRKINSNNAAEIETGLVNLCLFAENALKISENIDPETLYIINFCQRRIVEASARLKNQNLEDKVWIKNLESLLEGIKYNLDLNSDNKNPNLEYWAMELTNIINFNKNGQINNINHIPSRESEYINKAIRMQECGFELAKKLENDKINFGVADIINACEQEHIYAERNSASAGSLQNENSALSENIKVYPIPATTEIHLESNLLNGKYEIAVIDLTGKSIINIKGESTEKLKIDISKLKAGTYVIQIKSGDKLNTSKFVKIK